MVWANRWDALCVTLWGIVMFTLWNNAQGKRGPHVSMEDVSLLKDEHNPKCLSRFLDGFAHEFTCFFTTQDNATYDFYYTIDNPPRRTRCEVQVHRSEDGGFLHVCSFPPSDIFMYADILLEVLDPTQSSSLWSQTVTVEDNILLEPPTIPIVQNDNIGELLLSWQAECTFNLYYKIRVTSESNQTIKQGHNKFKEKLDHLMPGEEVKVQVSVKCSLNETKGHWSQWSPAVHAVVPQSADDISLTCTTKDLFSITCQWDSRHMATDYTLFFKMDSSQGHGRTQWTECFPETNFTDQCGFQGDLNKRIRVKLSRSMAPLNQTFYMKEFTLSSIVKTPPPSGLKNNITESLCLSWDAPLPALSAHLQYELNYRPATKKHWTMLSPNGPDTAVCLKLPWSSRFDVRVRAKPFGTLYSGPWSDWSDVLSADVKAHSSSHIMILIHCSPVFLLLFAVLLILLFSRYFKKLKQYVWPPVPNLDKVLQDFLTDFQEHKWDAPVTVKQFYGETTASVAEVLSKDDDSGLEEASENSARLLSSSDTSYSSMGQEDDSIETELYPDYVALNKNTIILCTKENSYIDEDLLHKKDKEVKTKEDSPKGSESSFQREYCLGSDFLNRSYIFNGTGNEDSKDREQRGQGNIYTNMPCN